jgi:Subtilase family
MTMRHATGGARGRYVRDSARNSAIRSHYHYIHDELVVADEDLDRVMLALRPRVTDIHPPEGLPGIGVSRLRLERPKAAIPFLMGELQDRCGYPAPRVAPNHAFRTLSHTMNSAFPPQPAGGARFQPPRDPRYGNGPRVVIGLLDSGVQASRAEFMGRCHGNAEPRPETDGDPLPPGAGHGTFVAGLLLNEAPSARIEARSVIDSTGFVDDFSLARTISELATQRELGVLHISVGTHTHDDAGTLAVEAALRHVRFSRPDVVVVAPAGNDGSSRPVFPAASKGVIGVGAVEKVNESWRRACFSNHGWWVDACAPGVDVLSLFPDDFQGELEQSGEPPEQLIERCHGHIGSLDLQRLEEGTLLQLPSGTARWSGTSAAAPVVAGRIAARLAKMSADQAVTDVLGGSKKSIPGLGVLVT